MVAEEYHFALSVGKGSNRDVDRLARRASALACGEIATLVHNHTVLQCGRTIRPRGTRIGSRGGDGWPTILLIDQKK